MRSWDFRIPRLCTTRAAASGASPKITSIPSTTWQCSASPTSPRCRCAWSPAAGFISAALSLILGFFYLLYKIVFWNSFSLGVAPLVLGLFFLGSVQLLCLGIIGEYVGSIHTFVQNRPLVIEKERINFPERSSS